MKGGRIPTLRLCAGLLAGLSLGPVARATPLSDGAALYRQRKYAEARAILEPLAAAEPDNAAAAYFLGMTLQRAGGPAALDSARAILARAVKLAPGNAGYLAEYAGVCLLMADRDGSLGLALEGREDMTRAIAENPADLDARDGLMQFYAKAPWPLGDPARALELAGDIAARNPKRGTAAYLLVAALFDRRGMHERASEATLAAQRLAPPPKD